MCYLKDLLEARPALNAYKLPFIQALDADPWPSWSQMSSTVQGDLTTNRTLEVKSPLHVNNFRCLEFFEQISENGRRFGEFDRELEQSMGFTAKSRYLLSIDSSSKTPKRQCVYRYAISGPISVQ